MDINGSIHSNDGFCTNKFGCRLVGLIPCSDAFGVDLIIDRYQDALAERAKEQKEKQETFLSSNPSQLIENGVYEMKNVAKTSPSKSTRNKVVESNMSSLGNMQQHKRNHTAMEGAENINGDEESGDLRLFKDSSSPSRLRVTSGGEHPSED